MNVSNDTRATMAVSILVHLLGEPGDIYKLAWGHTESLLAAAPSGDEGTYASLKDDAPHALNCECFQCDVERAGVDTELNFPRTPDGCGIPPAVIARMKGLEEMLGHVSRDQYPQLVRMYCALPPLPPGWDKPRVEPTYHEWFTAMGVWDKNSTNGRNVVLVYREAMRLASERAEREWR